MIEDRKPRFFYGYIIVLIALCFEVLAWGMWGSFPIFFEPTLAEFGWTRAATSGAFSLYLLVMAVIGIVVGRLNDRFGPKIIITVCSLSLGLGYLLMSQINTLWQLYLFYGVMLGIGCSGFIALSSTVTRWFVRRRGLMLGMLAAGFGLTMVIMPPIATWLLSAYGWRNSYIIIGVVTMVLIIVGAQFLRRDPRQMGLLPYGEDEAKAESLNLQAIGLSFRESIYTRQLWVLCAVFFFFLLCYAAIAVHIVIHATGMGISLASAANILVIGGAASIPGAVLLGITGDRIGHRRALVLICVLMLIALLWLLVAKELWMLYLFAVIYGLAFGGIFALISPVIAELFGLRAHGVIMGFTNFIGMAGEAVGPVMAGYIFDVTSSYNLAFLICAVVSFIALILSLLLRPIDKEGRFIHD